MGKKMNLKDAARALNLPENYLRSSILKGQIPFLMAGRRYILDVEDVEEILRMRARENMERCNAGTNLVKGVLRMVK